MERGVATAIMDAAKESGMNVHISVPIGPTDMQNIRAVEFAVSLATLAEYEGMVQLFILGDRVLSYQTQNHMQKVCAIHIPPPSLRCELILMASAPLSFLSSRSMQCHS
jgi:hypothetical protein